MTPVAKEELFCEIFKAEQGLAEANEAAFCELFKGELLCAVTTSRRLYVRYRNYVPPQSWH